MSFAGARLRAAETAAEPGWYCINTWQQAQGLAQNMVYAVLQTSDGYIWTGTRGGVSRFDGMNFTTFDDRRPNQLKEVEVWTLLEDPGGGLWIGTFGGGVSRLKDGRFTSYTAADGLVNNFVSSLVRDTEGAIWIGTDQGVSRFKDGRFTNFTGKDMHGVEHIRTLFADRDGSVWVGSVKGEVARFVGGRCEAPAIDGPRPTWEVRAFVRDRAGDLWIGSFDGVFRLHGSRSVLHTPAQGLSSELVYTLFEDAEGTMWAGTTAGLDRFVAPEGVFHNEYKTADEDPVLAIGQDREGSLWVGARSGGLARLRRGLFKSFTRSSGMPDDSVTAMVCGRHGRVWLGTRIGLQVLEDGKFTAFDETHGLPSRRVEALLEDRVGRLWVGSVNGLYRSTAATDDPAWRAAPRFVALRNPDIPGMNARGLFEDRAGAIWVATIGDGLACLRGGQFTTYTTKDGLGHNAVRGLCEDPAGDLWCGTREGLSRFHDGKFATLTTADGLASNAIGTLYQDKENALWLGTRYGVSWFRNGRFTNITVRDGLPANYVYSFIEDDRGNLWMTCSKGVFRAARAQLEAFAAGRIKTIEVTAYAREHGLNTTSLPAGYAPLSGRDAEGRLWFATFAGLSVVDPARLAANTLAPPVHIERVMIDHRDYASDRTALVPPGRGDLEFHYTALSFVAPEKVRFKYRLVGYDQEWVDPGTRRAAYYSNIPPGEYAFQVKGANNDGVWNEAGAVFAFRLEPHFYETYWFYGVCGLGVLLAGVGAHHYRTRLLRAREQTLVHVVAERTKELRGYQERLEEQVAERTSALRANRELLQSIIDGSPALIYLKDLEGRLLLVNRRFAELCGAPKETLVGKTAGDLFPKAEADALAAHDRAACTATKPVEVEEVFTLAGGPRTYLSIRCALRDEAGRPHSLCGMSTDITRAKQMEEQLRQSQKMDAIGRLAGGIAHDFNNLLTGINGFASLALQDLTPHHPAAGFLRQVLQAGEKARSLTRQLLAYSRKQVMVVRRWDLGVIASDMEALLRRIVGEDIDLSTVLNPGSHDVLVDRGQVEQIILNLAVNARDAMPEGGKLVVEVANLAFDAGYVALHPEITAGPHVMLAVSDTGAGMTAEVKARLFEPFFTTKEPGKGTGLGLSVVYGIVKQSGGSISVYSEAGQGTTFRIYFPAAKGGSAAGTAPAGAALPQPLRGGETILLVEDEELVRNFARTALEANGYKVVTARHGRAALELLGQPELKIDLVLTDMIMPDVGGRELGERLQALRPDLPVIYMSGYSEQVAPRRSGAAAAPQFLAKPFGPSELLVKVRASLKRTASP